MYRHHHLKSNHLITELSALTGNESLAVIVVLRVLFVLPLTGHLLLQLYYQLVAASYEQ